MTKRGFGSISSPSPPETSVDAEKRRRLFSYGNGVGKAAPTASTTTPTPVVHPLFGSSLESVGDNGFGVQEGEEQRSRKRKFAASVEVLEEALRSGAARQVQKKLRRAERQTQQYPIPPPAPQGRFHVELNPSGTVSVYLDPVYMRILAPRYPHLLTSEPPRVGSLPTPATCFPITLSMDMFNHIVETISSSTPHSSGQIEELDEGVHEEENRGWDTEMRDSCVEGMGFDQSGGDMDMDME